MVKCYLCGRRITVINYYEVKHKATGKLIRLHPKCLGKCLEVSKLVKEQERKR